MKYSLNNGLTNFSITINSTINQEAWQVLWNSLSDGDSITITFYANDTLGNLGSESVTIIKESLPSGTPIISFGSFYLIVSVVTIILILILAKHKFKKNQ